MKTAACIALCIMVALIAIGPASAIRISINPSDQINNTSPDGRLELSARGNDGIIYHAWQQPGTTWSAWFPL